MIKVLIVTTNAFGDTYLSTSVIENLKEIDPYVQIDFVSSFSSRFILNCLPI